MMNNYPFPDPPDTACFTCRHVLNEHKPILYISHDEDGSWQFLCGGNHREKDARIVSLAEIMNIDASVSEYADLDYGECVKIGE